MSDERFTEGELFVYVNGDRWELGMVKRPNNRGDGYFCWYSTGDTAANTPTFCMHKLANHGFTKVEGLLRAATDEQRWHDRAVMLAALARNLLYMHGDLLDRSVKAQGFSKEVEDRALEENFKCIEYWESMIRSFLGEEAL